MSWRGLLQSGREREKLVLRSPARSPRNSKTRFWANGECGAIFNNLFGQSAAGIRYADDVISGSGNRAQNRQTSLSRAAGVVAGVIGAAVIEDG